MLRELCKIFKVIGGGKNFIFLLLLRCPFDAIRSILQALFLQESFIAINEKNISNLYLACGIFSIGSLLLFLYNGTIWIKYSSYIIRLESNLRKKSFEHVSRLSLEDIDTRSTGEWYTRLNTDVQMNILNKPLHLPHVVVACVSILVSAVILLVIHSQFFVIIILFIIPHVLINQTFLVKPMGLYATKVQEATDRNTTDMNTLITCADTAMLYDGWDFLLGRFEDSSLYIHKVNMDIKRRSSIGDAILPIMGLGGYLTLLLIASFFISSGTMTFGNLTAVFQYRGSLLTGTLMLINSLINIKIALVGVKRINETIHMKLED